MNTVYNLRGLCRQWPSIFRGYSQLRKVELLAFMREKLTTNNYLIAIDEDGHESDIDRATRIVSIEPAQDTEQLSPILPIFEDRLPAVGPPAYPPPSPYPSISPDMWGLITDELERRVYAGFTDYERMTIEEDWPLIGMTAQEIINFTLHEQAVDEYDYDVFQEYNDAIEIFGMMNVEELVQTTEVEFFIDFIRKECIAPTCPECPVCYEKKPGMVVKTSCGHQLCLPCLNRTWEAGCGVNKWMERPCPMCRANITTMEFVPRDDPIKT